MKYPDFLQNAIDKNDVVAVRAALITIADDDSKKTTPEAKTFAYSVEEEFKSKSIQIFEEDNGHLVLPPEDEWTLETWDVVKGAMQFNFSRQKFDLAETILLSLRKKGVKELQPRMLKSDNATNPGTETGAKLGTVTGAKPGTETGTKLGTETGTKLGTETGTKPGTETGTKSGTKTGTKSGTVTGAKPGAGTRPHVSARQPMHQDTVDIVDGLILVGGIIVGAIVAGTVGGIIGGVAGAIVAGKRMLGKR